MRYPADKIFFKNFQRAITPKGGITRKRKKHGLAIFYEESKTLALTVSGGGVGLGGGGGGCERSIEFFVKIEKKMGGGGVGLGGLQGGCE